MNPINKVLSTDRLQLTPFKAADAEFLHRLWTDPQVRLYLWDDRIITHQETEEAITAGIDSFALHGFGYWLVSLRESARPVGFAGLRHFDNSDKVELMYGLAPAEQGQGLATEASTAVIDHGFRSCRLKRIYAGTDPPNSASIRVMQRLGMTFEGERIIEGISAVYYSMDRNDWPGTSSD